MIELYQSFQSTCSGKVRLVMEEKGIPYTERDVNLATGEQFDPDYMKLNPKAVVPTIVHDGRVLTESSLIMEYLDETFDGPSLTPDDPYKQWRMRMFNKLLDEEVHAYINLVTYAVVGRHTRSANRTPEEIEEHFRKMPDQAKAERQRQVHEKGVHSEPFRAAIKGMDKLLAEIEGGLEEFGGPWILGGEYSIADAAVTTYVLRLDVCGFEDMWAGRRPLVAEWWRRIRERPNFVGAVSPRTPRQDIDSRKEYGAEALPTIRELFAA